VGLGLERVLFPVYELALQKMNRFEHFASSDQTQTLAPTVFNIKTKQRIFQFAQI